MPSREMAKSIEEAIRPDNEEVPPDTKIELGLSNSSLIIRITSTADIPSFIRTIDDLLVCINAAEKTLRELSG
ncbi:MAG: KEOPS complex subunit Pcc1 [Candidatus Methanomethyliaceae archaeon]|nr:KEOPS complex subunit Pcc1 [Candidatus Methanomethyliaceae archaeon]MCX8169541.1 KEOPS complex subunit Pcc1 [Candidatus Methanomethyliaceae archaeon]MDW7970400.1 KEOPS complex subunit Pcc1 [Nitrososphaerota archaeon]